eukprot:7580517-Pyramimonas_sp.AAC.1
MHRPLGAPLGATDVPPGARQHARGPDRSTLSSPPQLASGLRRVRGRRLVEATAHTGQSGRFG